MPNCPIVACRMTDLDVVERVAAQFGTAVMTSDKGKYRTEFAAVLKGAGAAALMSDIRRLMGRRRKAAIDAAIADYCPPSRKLDFATAQEIRRRFAAGNSVASLAHTYDVARQTIYPILQNRIYQSPPDRPWRDPAQSLPVAGSPPQMSPLEFHRLAGWLEGEGSFLAPPPSDPRRARISAGARDKDVVFEVGRLLGSKPGLNRSALLRNPKWSPMWRLLIQGSRAMSLMTALEPHMGLRRRTQIRRAVVAAVEAQQDRRSIPSHV